MSLSVLAVAATPAHSLDSITMISIAMILSPAITGFGMFLCMEACQRACFDVQVEVGSGYGLHEQVEVGSGYGLHDQVEVGSGYGLHEQVEVGSGYGLHDQVEVGSGYGLHAMLFGKVVTLCKKLEDVQKDIKEAERCVILKINQLHPHISLSASTIDVCMPVSTTGLEAHSHCDRIVKEAGVSILTLSVGLGRVNGCVFDYVHTS